MRTPTEGESLYQEVKGDKLVVEKRLRRGRASIKQGMREKAVASIEWVRKDYMLADAEKVALVNITAGRKKESEGQVDREEGEQRGSDQIYPGGQIGKEGGLERVCKYTRCL